MRILVVEDELDLQEAIIEGLRLDGYAVDGASDGEEAYEKIMIETYDLIILDINLPKLNGLQLLEKIRQHNSQVKVLILSARGSISDKVIGLDYGANDYLIKPFDFLELEARIRNLLRWQFTSENSLIEYGPLVLNSNNKTLTIKDESIKLTKKEYGILEYLLNNQDKIISQEALIEHVWDELADPFSTSVRVHIATLRKKLIEKLDFDLIETRVGEGYLIKKEDN